MRCFTLSFLFLLLFRPIWAQQIEQKQVPLPEAVRTSALDLLYVDDRGFLWVSAGAALFWYDGQHFHPVATDTIGHPKDKISALYRDHEQSLWVGWKSGRISLLQNDSLRLYEPEEGIPSAEIVGFIEDSQNRLWMATDGEGLYLRDTNERWLNFNLDDGLPSNEGYDLARDDSGVLLATDHGLLRVDYQLGKKQIELIDQKDGLSDQIVKSVYRDENGIWLGFYEPYINRLTADGKTEKWPAPADDVHQLIRTGYVSWWLGENGNLYRSVSPGNFQKIQVGLSAQNRVEHLAVDKEGHLWVSSQKGLFSFDLWLTRFSLSAPATAITAKDSLLWFGMAGNLLQVNLNTGQLDTLIEGNKRILSLHADARGNIWAGTFDAGVYLWNLKQKSYRQITEAQGLVNNNVLSIAGNHQAVWLGTLGGVTRVDLESSAFPSFVTAKDALGENLQYIYVVHVSAQNQVFIGTDGKGILQWNGRHFEPLHSTWPNPVVIDLNTDTKGNVWWLSPEGGLYCSSPAGALKSIKPSPREAGRVAGVMTAPDGSVLKFAEGAVERYLPAHDRWEIYGRAYGLANLQPELHAQVWGREQQIFCGTTKGIAVLQFNLLANRPEPATFITGVELFLNPTQKHEFTASDNHISFNYLGRWYIDPGAVRYRIKLEGYDLDWNISQDQNVTYPRLAPGNYTFKVLAGVGDYFPDEQMKSYSFTILKPWYLQWYGLLLELIAIALVIYAIVQWRTRQLKLKQAREQEQVRAQFETLKSQVNPHFLFNSFNTLMALIEEEDKAQASQYLSDLSDFFRNILEFRQVDLISLGEELRIIKTYLDLQRIRYSDSLQDAIMVDEHYLTTRIPPLSLQILLENAFKHNVISRAKPLKIRIYAEGDYLTIWNERQARKKANKSTGYGLESIVKKYSFYTRKEVKIEMNEKEFIVRLPLLEK